MYDHDASDGASGAEEDGVKQEFIGCIHKKRAGA